jgi:Tfp pilus assembly protein FimT
MRRFGIVEFAVMAIIAIIFAIAFPTIVNVWGHQLAAQMGRTP